MMVCAIVIPMATRHNLTHLFICTACVVLIPCLVALADINGGTSVAWLALSQPHIGVYTIATVSESVVRIDTKLGYALKGVPVAGVRVKHRVSRNQNRNPADDDMRKGDELLLFLNNAMDVEYAINLTRPATRGDGVAFSVDFDILRHKYAIVKTVTQRIARQQASGMPRVEHVTREHADRTSQTGFLRLEVPRDSAAFDALFLGSSCYLVVPADPEFKEKVIAQLRSPHMWDRAAAADQAQNYRSDDTIAVLTGLLTDSGVFDTKVRKNGAWVDSPVYPVRQVAYDTLISFGLAVPRPDGYVDEWSRYTRP